MPYAVFFRVRNAKSKQKHVIRPKFFTPFPSRSSTRLSEASAIDPKTIMFSAPSARAVATGQLACRSSRPPSYYDILLPVFVPLLRTKFEETIFCLRGKSKSADATYISREEKSPRASGIDKPLTRGYTLPPLSKCCGPSQKKEEKPQERNN